MNGLPAEVLLATDGSPDAALATRVASDLCSRAGSALRVVHVGQDISDYVRHFEAPEEYAFLFADEARELLEREVRSIERRGCAVAEARLELGDPVEEIVDLAEDLENGLIVVGSRGLGPVELLVLGSVAEGVVHRAPCPVLVVRGGEGCWPPSEIVVGDDGSEEAARAGDLAARIGGLFGSEATLVRGLPRPPRRLDDARTREDEHRSGQKEALRRRASELARSLARPPRNVARVGDAAALILDEAGASRGTLIAVGRRGAGAGDRGRGAVTMPLLGSVSTKVLRAAPGPVLVYPQDA
ncbi:hypothetical protein GBA65_07815 [Rubrobacter marinus]|uniref:UspA domain-containing protein n=1 Tax=Rubrobacter marinus TaxID=2653852 RepID=A0A6G8PWC1_9ACTN|nr:universal stress protein [Rubrobacter marinus]QIN78447.1 hypothetical protein GBA65_07815 [Rubrobacter marinus]